MKNLFNVLKQKEGQVQQLQRDLEVLRAAARMLVEESDAVIDQASAAGVGDSQGTYSAARDNSPTQFP
jgi:hypothetical protein